jgi:hypothetical protein
VTIAWEIKNVRSNGFLLTTPGPTEFTLRALPRPDQGTAGHPFANGVRALDAAFAQTAAISIKCKLYPARRNPTLSLGLIAICTPRNEVQHAGLSSLSHRF